MWVIKTQRHALAIGKRRYDMIRVCNNDSCGNPFIQGFHIDSERNFGPHDYVSRVLKSGPADFNGIAEANINLAHQFIGLFATATTRTNHWPSS